MSFDKGSHTYWRIWTHDRLMYAQSGVLKTIEQTLSGKDRESKRDCHSWDLCAFSCLAWNVQLPPGPLGPIFQDSAQ